MKLFPRARLLILASAAALLAAGPVRAETPAGEGASLYQLAPALTDQEGRATDLDVFRGSPVLVSMFYASCPYVCPLLLQKIRAFEAKLTPEERARLRVVVVSFDTADTPETLRLTMEKQKIDGARWRLAVASEADVRELAAALGIQYRKLPDGSFNHSTVLTLLDGRGVPTARLEGLGQPDDTLLDAFRGLDKPAAAGGIGVP